MVWVLGPLGSSKTTSKIHSPFEGRTSRRSPSPPWASSAVAPAVFHKPIILGLFRDNGKENGNYCLGFTV